MYSLPRIRLCAAQQPIATSALFAYLGAVVSTVVYLAIQGDGSTALANPPGPDPSLHGLQRHALNAFLVPLLDDAVFHEEAGYSAVVHPQLVVRTVRTTERWSQAFAATTPWSPQARATGTGGSSGALRPANGSAHAGSSIRRWCHFATAG